MHEMADSPRRLSYPEAIWEATAMAMESDPTVFVMGLGVDDPKGTLGTTLGLKEKFGSARVIDTPLSEDAMTGVAIGAALAGQRPIHVHIRNDFLLLAMNQLVNMAAKYRYMFGGQFQVPMVVRALVGKSWGQGPQHSQALHSLFMHVPGLKVAAPATPYDAKGVLLAAIADNNPVILVEHRLLYYQKGFVPEERYVVGPGHSRITAVGDGLTLVGISQMQVECLRARRYLESVGLRPEVIDPIWLSPMDVSTIAESVQRTQRLCMVDNGWLPCGAGAEVVAAVVELLEGLPIQVRRLGFAPTPCPTTPALEHAFYPDSCSIAMEVYRMMTGHEDWRPVADQEIENTMFKGPF